MIPFTGNSTRGKTHWNEKHLNSGCLQNDWERVGTFLSNW
jgi:hypothetical protein